MNQFELNSCKKYFFILLCSLIIIKTNAQAELTFSGQRLESIFLQLPAETKETIQLYSINNISDTSLNILINHDVFKLVINFSSAVNINHLGLMVYEKTPKTENITPIIQNFIERFLLEYLLANDKLALISTYEQKKVYVTLYGFLKISQLEPYLHFDKHQQLEAKIGDQHTKVLLPLNSSNILEFILPNDLGILQALDKSELEFHLLTKLSAQPKVQFAPLMPEIKTLEKYSDSIFISRGKLFGKDSLIHSHTFYWFDGANYKPINDRKYPKERLHNIFQLLIISDEKILLWPVLYKTGWPNLEINLTELVVYFYKDFDIYLGWQSETTDYLIGSLFLKHKWLNHCHLITFQYKKNLCSAESDLITGHLYLFTPNVTL